MELSQKRHTHL